MDGVMEEQTGEGMRPGPEKKTRLRSWLARVVILLLCLSILGGGIAGAYYIITTGPRPAMRKPIKSAPLVRTQEVGLSNEQIIVKAMGTVIPAREIILKSRVAGEVVSVNPEFMEGGFLKAGSVILRVDPKDYELALKQMRTQVINAEYSMKLEMGQQDIARYEWKLLSDRTDASELDKELALRKPHLEKAEADLAAAEADLEQAKLNLSRTKIHAPFNAVVLSKTVDMGSQVSTQDQLAELVGSDEFWIRVPLPMDRLKWIKIPDKAGDVGSKVRIHSGNGQEGHSHTGRVIRLLSDLEDEGRMPRILVSVKNPLGLGKKGDARPPLLMGQYVRVEIEGKELKGVISISRAYLRDSSNIWILDEDNKLRIREVDTVWRDEDRVLLHDTVKAGEKLIISDLQTPVEGMELRTGGQDDDQIQIDNQIPGTGPFPGGAPPGEGDFMANDTDNDGKVSKDEFKGPPMFFDMFDKDGDGYISEDEAPKGPPPGGGFPQG